MNLRLFMILAVISSFFAFNAFGQGTISTKVANDDALKDSTVKTNKLHKLGRDSQHGLSLLGRDRPGAEKKPDPHAEAKEIAKKMGEFDDSLVFAKIGEEDQVTWGELHRDADKILSTSISKLSAALGNGEAIDEVRLSLYQQTISRLLQGFIRSAVVAQEAKKAGIVVTDEEIAEETKVQKDKLKSGSLSALQSKMLVNGLYQKAYIEKFIRPNIKVSGDAIAELIAKRHEMNLSVPATNALLRAQLEDIRGRLVRKEIDWSDAAEEYSECPDCSGDNGDCGTWEEDEEDRGESLLKVCFSIPTNTVSEVVETPSAFHLVKITDRYVPTLKAREEDGEVSTVEVRHIQIDKWELDPEFTEESAKAYLEGRLIARQLKKKQNELIGLSKIESVIPLKSGKNSQRPLRLFNRRGMENKETSR